MFLICKNQVFSFYPFVQDTICGAKVQNFRLISSQKAVINSLFCQILRTFCRLSSLQHHIREFLGVKHSLFQMFLMILFSFYLLSVSCVAFYPYFFAIQANQEILCDHYTKYLLRDYDVFVQTRLSYVYPTYILRVSYVYPTCMVR